LGPEYLQFLPIIAILAVFYLLILMPQQRRQRKVQDMIDNLKNGDKIITSGGIYGTVVSVRDDRIQVRVAENVKLEISRNAVTALQNPEENKE
jgi:preprotein translocase subunit YajC